MTTKNTHGGKREGAGRKAQGATKQVRIRTTAHAKLAKFPKGQWVNVISDLIEKSC